MWPHVRNFILRLLQVRVQEEATCILILGGWEFHSLQYKGQFSHFIYCKELDSVPESNELAFVSRVHTFLTCC